MNGSDNIEPCKITLELNLKNIIAESREVAQALNEFADNLEQIEKKYAELYECDECDECFSVVFPECRYCKHHTLRCMPEDHACKKCVRYHEGSLPSGYQQKEEK